MGYMDYSIGLRGRGLVGIADEISYAVGAAPYWPGALNAVEALRILGDPSAPWEEKAWALEEMRMSREGRAYHARMRLLLAKAAELVAHTDPDLAALLRRDAERS